MNKFFTCASIIVEKTIKTHFKHKQIADYYSIFLRAKKGDLMNRLCIKHQLAFGLSTSNQLIFLVKNITEASNTNKAMFPTSKE